MPFWVWVVAWIHLPEQNGKRFIWCIHLVDQYMLCFPQECPPNYHWCPEQLSSCTVSSVNQRHWLERISGGHLVQPLLKVGLLPALDKVSCDFFFFIGSWKPWNSITSLGRWHLCCVMLQEKKFFSSVQSDLPRCDLRFYPYFTIYFTIICAFSKFAICLNVQSM